MKQPLTHTRFFIIGNADEQQALTETVGADDIIIRFNNPNPSCTLQADWLFLANGYTQCRKLQLTNQHLFKPDMAIFFRYFTADILYGHYQNIPYSRRLKYLFRFPSFKKRYQLNQYEQTVVASDVYRHCAQIIGNRQPSTGLLAIYHILANHPQHTVFVHNFTNEGWVGHDWDGERVLMQKLLQEQKIIAV